MCLLFLLLCRCRCLPLPLRLRRGRGSIGSRLLGLEPLLLGVLRGSYIILHLSGESLGRSQDRGVERLGGDLGVVRQEILGLGLYPS